MGEGMAEGAAQPPLVVILGPTGVGKTALSLHLARVLNGEIVSADSRQIYREMDIGTGKATAAEQAVAPHHLLDLRRPDEVLTLAEFQRLAFTAIAAIHGRHRLPLLVGGSALYVRAVVEGLQIPPSPPDPALRANLEAELAAEGVAALFARLQALDPVGAAAIDRKNPRRVVRALEIRLVTGESKVALAGAQPPPYRILRIGLNLPREELYRRIDARVDAMLAGGLLAETERLLAAGYAPALPAMTSLGYREMSAHLRGELALAEAATRMKTETHRYVRHQLTWFRKMGEIHWFEPGEGTPVAVEQLIRDWLASPGRG
jgi:tRNA dimethylallyltransferase